MVRQSGCGDDDLVEFLDGLFGLGAVAQSGCKRQQIQQVGTYTTESQRYSETNSTLSGLGAPCIDPPEIDSARSWAHMQPALSTEWPWLI